MMGNYDRGYEVGMGGLTDGIFHPTSEGGLIISPAALTRERRISSTA